MFSFGYIFGPEKAVNAGNRACWEQVEHQQGGQFDQVLVDNPV